MFFESNFSQIERINFFIFMFWRFDILIFMYRIFNTKPILFFSFSALCFSSKMNQKRNFAYCYHFFFSRDGVDEYLTIQYKIRNMYLEISNSFQDFYL